MKIDDFTRDRLKYAYQVSLTPAEYNDACFMSARGYLGELIHHATVVDTESSEDEVVLLFHESDAWKVLQTIEEDPDAVWALTNTSTRLGRVFQEFIDSIV